MELTTLTPCDSCQTPIATDTHAEEMGLCLKCSDDYLNHTCDKCGEEEVANLAPPFTRLCPKCEQDQEPCQCGDCSDTPIEQRPNQI